MTPETFYHIYNHANGLENLFRSDENYRFFLRQWNKYIEPVANNFAYCLMPNHFHFLVRIRSEKEIISAFGKFETFQMLEQKISKHFSNLFSSYTQALNKMYGRRGSLFMPNFKRKEIDSEEYLSQIIVYIHRNPIHHGFSKNLEDWNHSSYHTFFSSKKTNLQRQQVLDWFGNLDGIKDVHLEPVKLQDKSLLIDF